MLAKKRENEAKFKSQGKPDKVYMAQEEIKEVCKVSHPNKYSKGLEICAMQSSIEDL